MDPSTANALLVFASCLSCICPRECFVLGLPVTVVVSFCCSPCFQSLGKNIPVQRAGVDFDSQARVEIFCITVCEPVCLFVSLANAHSTTVRRLTFLTYDASSMSPADAGNLVLISLFRRAPFTRLSVIVGTI